eukprot:845365-Prorocentrum_minimum.AAC.1
MGGCDMGGCDMGGCEAACCCGGYPWPYACCSDGGCCDICDCGIAPRGVWGVAVGTAAGKAR